MKCLLTTVACSLVLLTGGALASSHKEAPMMAKGASAPMAGGSCATTATEKKLAGAAKTSFMKKCEADAGGAAKPTCESQAADKKLAGAAKTSFVKKCTADAAKAA